MKCAADGNDREGDSIERLELEEVETREHGGRRIARARRLQRQNLPQRLLGSRQPVDKLVCGGTEVANPSVRGQRGRVQQNTG